MKTLEFLPIDVRLLNPYYPQRLPTNIYSFDVDIVFVGNRQFRAFQIPDKICPIGNVDIFLVCGLPQNLKCFDAEWNFIFLLANGQSKLRFCPMDETLPIHHVDKLFVDSAIRMIMFDCISHHGLSYHLEKIVFCWD